MLTALAGCSAALALPDTGLAAVPAGIMLTLLLPGVAIVQAIPATRVLSVAERAILSSALSLATIVLGGIVLHTAGIRLTKAAWGGLCLGVTLIAVVVGMMTRRRVPLAMPGRSARAGAGHGSGRGLGTGSVAWRLVPFPVAIVLLAAASWLSFYSIRHQQQTPFTALWIAPTSEVGRVTIGVDSYEGRTVTFLVRVRTPTTPITSLQMVLGSEREWATTLDVPASERIIVELYKDGEDSIPYRSVELAASGTPGGAPSAGPS